MPSREPSRGAASLATPTSPAGPASVRVPDARPPHDTRTRRPAPKEQRERIASYVASLGPRRTEAGVSACHNESAFTPAYSVGSIRRLWTEQCSTWREFERTSEPYVSPPRVRPFAAPLGRGRQARAT